MRCLRPLSINAANRYVRTLAIAAVGLMLIATPACAGWFGSSKTNLTPEMKGKWRDVPGSRHTHEFQSNGNVKGWYEGISMDVVGTWKRDGSRITIKMKANWDFTGELNGGEIRGKMTIRDSKGAALTPTDGVWKRD